MELAWAGYKKLGRFDLRPWLLLVAIAFTAAPAKAQEQVALELILAVDCSSSVSNGEFTLQMQGIAKAFEHPAVQAAVAEVGPDGIAVALLQWSSNANTALAVDWMRVRGPASAKLFASRVRAAPRVVGGGFTAIGRALTQATALIQNNGFVAPRQVIDLSGDGISNQGPPPNLGQASARAAGVVVNALAILNEDRSLGSFYADHVITGNGAFLETAKDYQDFADAILRKLVTEISGPPLAWNAPPWTKLAQDPFYSPKRDQSARSSTAASSPPAQSRGSQPRLSNLRFRRNQER